jgi:hypothetical protein
VKGGATFWCIVSAIAGKRGDRMSIPTSPDQLLTRNELAAALTEQGFPTSPATLATRATRGGGPVFQKYGPRVLYRWGSGLDWAKSRLSAPVGSTSEFASKALSDTQESAA